MKFSPAVFLQDFKTIFSMSAAIVRGKYKMPWGTLSVAVLCTVYLLSPVDILPDVIPFLGITDDGTFILLVLSLLHKNLSAYRQSQLSPAEKANSIPAQSCKRKK